MKERYIRNRIYLTEKEQQIIKNYPILLGGAGIGSVIAECALRFGFENLTIIDGDQIELSNLNRQNYIEKDVNKDKVVALKERLLSINKQASITIYNKFLTVDNLLPYIENHKIAINALDFSSNVPLVFDQICRECKIPVLHPYNLGWAGLVAVITPDSKTLDSIVKPNDKFNEIEMVKYISNYLKSSGNSKEWLDEVLDEYLNEEENLSPPQLSIGAWIVASMCTHLMYNIAVNKVYKKFPEFYFSSIN